MEKHYLQGRGILSEGYTTRQTQLAAAEDTSSSLGFGIPPRKTPKRETTVDEKIDGYLALTDEARNLIR